MNRKQNILLCYLAFALIVLLTIGFNNDDLEMLNKTTFSIVVLLVLGCTALIATRGEDGLDYEILKSKIFPILYVLTYFSAAYFLLYERVEDLIYQPISKSIVSQMSPTAQIRNSHFTFDKANLKNWIVNEAEVSIYKKSVVGPDQFLEKLKLICYRDYKGVDNCFGDAMYDYSG